MKNFRVFDIVGPRMIGPSSSHTAGAAKIGMIGYKLASGDISSAKVTLFGSFATTGIGHGTDKAIVGGLLGFYPEDERIRDSLKLAEEQGKKIDVVFSDVTAAHPNTAKIELIDSKGEETELLAASIGGGNIEVKEINGMQVSFSCEYPTVLVFHHDVPGVIGKTTNVFAEENINIAFMKVFRTSKSQSASMVIETDTEVTDEVLSKIESCTPEIMRVITI